ncbi:hypothetical protein E2542_SST26566 [Spatholobus suberectus]|nr:hypothetical protein E2542_SST26566 [Spatholobus suberectus]
METERERPHRSTSSNSSSTSELFVCFTSRLSSSSMKLSSKSILSPSRSRDPPQISLSSSLSRRLKGNGSMKGGQASPMFPTGGKRRGCGFENPEPSSPKVTCIGQVRVKTKKQGKKMRARSKRRGEASFRKAEQQAGVNANANPDLTRQNSQGFQHHQNCLKHRNQRWVHLPLTICEALREFSCFFPCRSSCMSSEREKAKEKEKEKEKGGGVEGGGHGREAAFGRWLVALQEGEGKGRGIELVMEEEDGRERGGERSHSQRRHVFEDIDVDLVVGEEEEKKHEELVGEEEEKARVSICIPPKNALLLMRCRSDPVKMAALANRFWESPVHKDKCQEEEQEEDSGDEEQEQEQEEEEEGDKDQHIQVKEEDEQEEQVERETTKEDNICERETETAVVASEEAAAAAKQDIENPKTEEEEANLQEGKGEERENDESSELSSSPETFTVSERENDEAEPETAETSEGSTEEEEKVTAEWDSQPDPTRNSNSDPESKERENGSKREERERETLPECLLLMMCEPKLSMEVSKETWVCSTDFIRWLPERPAGAEKRVAGEMCTKPKPKPKPSPPLMQPPRSSCSFPAAGGGAGMSMATMIEQKLAGSKSGNNGYEPFVLTRCKSEPMRSSAKFAPEACFWNNRKLEPHPPAAQLGVGAPAGVGF